MVAAAFLAVDLGAAPPTLPAEVSEILERFVTRAFRRPARPAELDRLAALVESETKKGEAPAAALKTGLLAALCSKDFFYIIEGSPERDPEQRTRGSS